MTKPTGETPRDESPCDPQTDTSYTGQIASLKRTLSERDRDLRECVELLERLEEPTELNPSNYNHEQVCELNAKMVELCLAKRALLARIKETP